MNATDNPDSAKARAAEGTYYSTAGELFNTRAYETFVGGYKKISDLRKDRPNKLYRRLLAGLGLGLVEAKTESRASERSQWEEYTPSGTRKKDLFGAINGEDAHQVPNADSCYRTYGPLLQSVMGIDLDNQPLEKLYQAAQIAAGPSGYGGGPNPDSKANYVNTILEYLAGEVRDLPSNWLRMPAPHGEVYDRSPSLITIPCISEPGDGGLDWIKKWGVQEKYSILIFASDQETYEAMIGAKAMNHAGTDCCVSIATPLEIRESCNLLKDMVKAQAELLAKGAVPGAVNCPQQFAKHGTLEEMTRSAKSLKNGRVRVPIPSGGGTVLKVELDPRKYQIPDPLLVLLKGAINWHYAMEGVKLLPACKKLSLTNRQEQEKANRQREEKKAHLLELYQEVLAETIEERLRPNSWEDLARGLGQFPTEEASARRVSNEQGEVEGKLGPNGTWKILDKPID